MEVTYEITPEDYWQYNLYYRQHKHPLRPATLNLYLGFLSLVCLGGVAILVDSLLKQRPISWMFLLSMLAMPWILFRLFPPTKGRTIKIARRHPGLLCQHTIGISPEWLMEKTPVNESKVTWTTVISIDENQDYLFLFVAKAAAHTIPKRAFSSLAEAQTFFDTSRRYWEAAKSGKVVAAHDKAVWPPPRSEK